MLGRGLESLIPKKDGSDKMPETLPGGAQQSSEPLSSQKSSQNSHGQPFIIYAHEPRKTSEILRSEPHKASGPAQRKRGDSVFQIEISKIKPNPYQPRKNFDDEGLQELAESIREFGVIQPLVVSKIERETGNGSEENPFGGTDVEYELLAGERRLLAAKKAGLETVPVIVRHALERHDKLGIALIENLQRTDLNPIEAARAYARLQDEFGFTQREIAVRVGKSREVIANTLRLLNLPPSAQDALRDGKLTESQARMILRVKDRAEQSNILNEALRNKISTREIKQRIFRGGIDSGSSAQASDYERKHLERKLEEHFGSPVKIVADGGRGKVIIQYFSNEEKEKIVEKILGEEV